MKKEFVMRYVLPFFLLFLFFSCKTFSHPDPPLEFDKSMTYELNGTKFLFKIKTSQIPDVYLGVLSIKFIYKSSDFYYFGTMVNDGCIRHDAEFLAIEFDDEDIIQYYKSSIGKDGESIFPVILNGNSFANIDDVVESFYQDMYQNKIGRIDVLLSVRDSYKPELYKCIVN